MTALPVISVEDQLEQATAKLDAALESAITSAKSEMAPLIGHNAVARIIGRFTRAVRLHLGAAHEV